MTWTIPDQGEPANDLQAVLFQSSLDALAAADALTGVVSGCAVTAQGSPDMTVAVAAGTVSVLGAQVAVASGNVTIGAADGTNPRLDLVVANSSGVKSVLAGTAAAAPKEPTLDTTTYVLLAQVYIPAAATTITTARITDRRVVVPGSGMGLGVYGDGSDGTVTFDGTTTILGLAPSSSTYTLSRDLLLAAGTINSGVTIITNGFRVLCSGTLTNNGTIKWNGGNAANNGAVPGLSNAGGTISNTTVGASSGSGGTTFGNTGGNTTVAYGGAGASGGNTGSAGGGGGTVTAPASSIVPIRSLPWASIGLLLGGNGSWNRIAAGAGGGGGAGDGTNPGGAGGGGGGIVIVAARLVAGTGAIQARGGNGANGTGGNAGGGGGGGGGLVVVISASVASGAVSGQTIDANGGTKGLKTGTGNDGSNGSNGVVIALAA